ncbi:MAG: hypothetical protein QHH24_07570 [Candidatus Bathyarchaeota archaeon]|nr:hypothetical protein [Candidatus Bathyarchaeota archaeon]
MRHHVGLTMDAKLYREIENIRGREKRSTFIEHLIRMGLSNYKKENSKISSKGEKARE